MSEPDKAKAVERLRKALGAIPGLEQLRYYDSPEFNKWRRNARLAITHTFGKESNHIAEFENISFSSLLLFTRDLKLAASLLESMIEEIEDYYEEEAQTPTLSSGRERERIAVKTDMKEVFVIHGRDNEAKEAVARFLARLDLEPVILHEQPNEGRTIIEKFEEHAQAAFAVVLLTPDDAGALENEKDRLRPRARQNVIFEFGYFIGRLGRKRVCALTRGDLEMPSDYDGVLYVPLDDAGAWRMRLVKELRAAGLNVDANRAL